MPLPTKLRARYGLSITRSSRDIGGTYIKYAVLVGASQEVRLTIMSGGIATRDCREEEASRTAEDAREFCEFHQDHDEVLSRVYSETGFSFWGPRAGTSCRTI